MTILSDEELRRRVQVLGRVEADGAPGFQGVLRGASVPRSARRLSGWLAPTAALLGMSALAVVLVWPRRIPPPTELAQPSAVATPVTPDGWTLPTDGLLLESATEADSDDTERLTHEIDALLRP